MAEPLLTLEDLATRWYLKSITLDQWRWNGKGPRYVKIGRHIFYRIQDVEAFEEQKAKKSTSFINDEDISKRILEHKIRERVK